MKRIVKMKECEHTEKEHEPVEGVLYRMCKHCRGIYAVKDLEYVKRRGELPADVDWSN